MAESTSQGGWTNLPEPGDGYPDARHISPAPLIEELEELKGFALRTKAVDPDDPKSLAILHVVERLRKRLWMGCRVPTEESPEEIASRISFTADTVRNWCQAGHVRHRRTGSGRYRVNVESALDYAAAR